jgi:hypothetical protein
VTLCARCGEREVPKRRTGRPRRYCEVCKPSVWLGADDELRNRIRAQVRTSATRRRALDRRKLVGELSLWLNVLRLDAIANEGADPRSDLCGCGRDYLTVPLEDAHLCIRPVRAH